MNNFTHLIKLKVYRALYLGLFQPEAQAHDENNAGPHFCHYLVKNGPIQVIKVIAVTDSLRHLINYFILINVNKLCPS